MSMTQEGLRLTVGDTVRFRIRFFRSRNERLPQWGPWSDECRLGRARFERMKNQLDQAGERFEVEEVHA